MRQDVTFDSEGTPGMGWPFQPGANAGRRSAAWMAPGFGRVKEMDLLPLAERITTARHTVVLSDPRYVALRGGQPGHKQP